MSGEGLLWLLVVLATIATVIKIERGRREYNLIACTGCHGDSLKTKWIFHLRSLRFRKVGKRCKKCAGQAWSDRTAGGWG